MKKAEIKVGGTFIAIVNRKETVVRVDNQFDNANGYPVTNLKTNRKTCLAPDKFLRPMAEGENCQNPTEPAKNATAQSNLMGTPQPSVPPIVAPCTANGSPQPTDEYTLDEDGNEVTVAPPEEKCIYCGAKAYPTPGGWQCAAYSNHKAGYEPEGKQNADPTISRPNTTKLYGAPSYGFGASCESKESACALTTLTPTAPVPLANGNQTPNSPHHIQFKGDEQRRFPTAPSAQSPISSPTLSTTSSKFGLAGALMDNKPAPHVQVQALAGTGKTTTLVEGMKLLRGMQPSITPSPQQQTIWDAMAQGKRDSIRFAAFGRAIARELQDRLATFGLDKMGCEASTFHSMGCKAVNKAFGRQSPDNAAWVVMDLAADIMGADVRELRKDPKKNRVLKAVDSLVGLCKQNLETGDQDSLDALCGHYDVDTDGVTSEVYELVPRVLEICKQPTGRITFDDMCYLPVIHNLPVPKTDMLLVDEVQDLNRMQQQLAIMSGHRVIMVGDKNQAIFGFAGADAKSMDNMRERLNATPLPLTVTRRCGKAIVREANRYVPSFEAHPSNCEGRIDFSHCEEFKQTSGQLTNGRPQSRKLRDNETDYKTLVKDGDFILCRTNAPLVQQCFRFLRMGRKANIQGRDVGKGLISTVDKLCKPYERVEELVRKLTDWLAKEQAKEMAKRYPSQNRIDALQDRADCLVCFTEGVSTVQDVTNKINAIFTDDKVGAGVRLSSIHKAKGLESKNVFILRPPNGPRTDKMKDWQLQQESNLSYVAVTRAIETLTYVT